LRQDGWTPIIFSYDWRKHVTDNAKLLKSFIDLHVQPGEKVDIVAHSMGGLVARNYVEQEGQKNKVDKLITIGTPHEGSVDVYPVWSAGLIPQTEDILSKFYLFALEKFCWVKTMSDRASIQQFFPSIQDLLPTFDYLIDNQTNTFKPIMSMNAKNYWLLNSSFGPPFNNITLGTLSGTNQQTQLALRVIPPNNQDIQQDNWLDGKPIQTITTFDGDNRVLTKSSMLPGATNIGPIDADHTHLISSTDGIDDIMDFLNGKLAAQALMLASPQTKTNNTNQTEIDQHKEIQPEPTSGLFFIGYPGRLFVIEPSGKIVQDTDGLISILDPKAGEYKIIFWPREEESRLVVAQIFENDKNFWKEYTLKSRFPPFFAPQIRFLYFDAKHSKEDILK